VEHEKRSAVSNQLSAFGLPRSTFDFRVKDPKRLSDLRDEVASVRRGGAVGKGKAESRALKNNLDGVHRVQPPS
jgi:hypothetical protein